MDDLISRKALLEDINAAAGNDFMGTMVAGTLSRFVKKQPAVDAAPVVHGRWKWIFGKPYCERCAIEPYRASNNEMPNYCPMCGRKLKGADNGKAD